MAAEPTDTVVPQSKTGLRLLYRNRTTAKYGEWENMPTSLCSLEPFIKTDEYCTPFPATVKCALVNVFWTQNLKN